MFKQIWKLGQIVRQTELQLLTEPPLAIKKKQLFRLIQDVVVVLANGIGFLSAIIMLFFTSAILFTSQFLQGQRQNLQDLVVRKEQYHNFMTTYDNSITFLVIELLVLLIFIIVFSIVCSIWRQYWHPLLGTMPKQDIRVLKMRVVLHAYTDSKRQLTMFFDSMAERREAELKLAQGMQEHALANVKVADVDYGWAQNVFKELRPEFDWDANWGSKSTVEK